MNDLKIYAINIGALLFTTTDVELILKISVLVLSIIYTSIGIYKRLKK